MVINSVGNRKLLEQLGFHRYALNTQPDEFIPEPPLQKNPGSACWSSSFTQSLELILLSDDGQTVAR